MGRHHVTIVKDEEVVVHQHYDRFRQAVWIVEVFMKKYDHDRLRFKIEEYVEYTDGQFAYKDITKKVITEVVTSQF